ncbi:MAG: hypothetical protein ACSLE4_06555 [Methyloceanibacter sp.]|uniref:hypothetical protein n=1 Tax=Methyloceanibacter sp. TaxID=1965321 RepID=UPI003EE25212
MPKLVSIRTLVLTAAALSLALAVSIAPASAQDAFDLSVPQQGEEAAPPPDLECAAESLSGSGPGFMSSRDESEEAALEAWLEKAQKVYLEATWDLAQDANISCAVQGLYSKCFADGIPCKPKGDGEAATKSE